jgi:hypothetical protein
MITDLFNFLLELFKTNTLVGVMFIFLCLFIILLSFGSKGIIYILQKSGIIKDQNTLLFESILKTLIEQFEKSSMKLSTLTTMLKVISDSIKSSLTNEEVNIITNVFFNFLKKEMLHKFINEIENNSINNLETNIKNIFDSTVKDIDRSYFQLPNTKGKVISTKDKIESFYEGENSTYIKILNILKNEDKIPVKKNDILIELDKLTQSWFMTIKNEVE